MSADWEFLCDDLQRDIMALVADEAACYFVCSRWQAWLRRRAPGPDEWYQTLVEAGLRLAYAHGEGGYYTWTLAAFGRWCLVDTPADRVEESVATGSVRLGGLFGGGMPPIGWGMPPVGWDWHGSHLEYYLCQRAESQLGDPAVPLCGWPAIDGYRPTRLVTRCAWCPTCDAGSVGDHTEFSWITAHNDFITEGRWTDPTGCASTDMGETPRLCVDLSGAPTKTEAPAGLYGGLDSGVGIYAEVLPLRDFEGSYFDLEAWMIFGAEREFPGFAGSSDTRPTFVWRDHLDAESVMGAFDAARADAAKLRVPGRAVTEDPEDAFQANDVHEMMKNLLMQDLALEWEEPGRAVTEVPVDALRASDVHEMLEDLTPKWVEPGEEPGLR